MSRNHFKKVMFSPYFQSEHYKDTPGGKIEKKIEIFLNKILKKLKIKK